MGLCEQYATAWPNPSDQAIAAAICQAESSGRQDAECHSCAGVPEDSYGLWQINTRANSQFDGPRMLSDPAYAAQCAYQIYQAQGWGAWSTYKNGAYLKYLGAVPDAPQLLTAPLFGPNGQPSPTLLWGAAIAAAVYLLTR